eukprot:CAMPEP_0185163494 /NCGR_PEP_ID=MMETSP1139-20130426/8070_1 /TAXON_ID=298111 /ORGANISM="Pavlova sp., Strain CCMP459" /LENGTH=186 /DNA_ID=CAMNT_0027728851 /DNA_START=1 /DNA_END=557 /DNA_ORIENTATION=-
MFRPMRRLFGGDCSDGPHHRTTLYNLACPYFPWLEPTPAFRHTLAPYLHRLEPLDALVAVHVRSRYVDFAGQPHTEWEKKVKYTWHADTLGWRAADHVDAMEGMFAPCDVRDWETVDAPCAGWAAKGAAGGGSAEVARVKALLSDPSGCGDGSSRWQLATKANGPVARAFTCAGHMAHSLARGVEP